MGTSSDVLDRQPTGTRRLDVELIRVICSFLIVWYHSRAGFYEYAYSGLVVFLLLSGFLWGRGRQQDILSRSKRLLLPWMFWFAVYAAYNLSKGRSALPGQSNLLLDVLAGPSIHLWYLPFLFFCLIAFDMLRARFANHIATMFFVIGWGGLALGLWWMALLQDWIRPLPQYVHGLPALVLGAGVGLISTQDRQRGLLLLLLTVGICASGYFVSGDINYMVYVLGLFVFIPVFCHWGKGSLPSILERLAGASLGVYVLHPLILIGVRKHQLAHGFAIVVLAYVASAIVTDLVRRLFPRFASYIF